MVLHMIGNHGPSGPPGSIPGAGVFGKYCSPQ